MQQHSGEQLDALSAQEKRALLAQLQAKRVQKPKTAPLSLAQERLLALCHLDSDSPAYNITTAYRLRGPLDVAALEQAINQIVRRQGALRTAFVAVNGQPAQVIAPEITLRVARHDLRALPHDAQEEQARECIVRQGRQAFDLGQAPLLRASVLHLGEEEHILAFTTHRLVFDGQCWPVLIAELGAFSQAGASDRLPELPLQYADFAVWQSSWLQSAVLDTQLAYWREQLSGRLPLLQLPVDHERAAMQIRSDLHSFTLPPEVSEALRQLSRQTGASLFVTLLAAFQALLHHVTDQENFVVFSSVAGRNRPELKGLIGLFANILALRADLSGRPTFRQLLERARTTSAGAYAHQDVPFEQLLEHMQFERDQRYTSIFQVMLVFWPEQLPPVEWPGMALRPLDIDIKPAEFDLLLHMTNTQPAMSGTVRYKADLFEPATIARLVAQFQRVLAAAVADPDLPVSELLRSTTVAEQGPVTGAVPLLPSQWGFLHTPERWVNMVEVVGLQQRADPALLAEAVQHLLAHHDALRTRFVYDGGWHQHLLAPGGAPPFAYVDLSQEPPEQRDGAIKASLAALQPRLGPLAEMLFHVTLFDQGPDQPGYLVFSVHHVIFDNASLPMLLEDLHAAYRQLAAGEQVRLPPKTTSVKAWAERLDSHLRSDVFRQRLASELALLLPPGAPLPVDEPAGRARNTLATTAQVQAALGAAETHLLLKELPRTHRVWLRDILLAGLVQAIAGWSGGERVTLQIVDNGRLLDLPGADDIDLARTAGCLFVPGILTLERPATDDPLAALREVRAQLSRYPTYGVAAGMAQQSGVSDAVPPTEVRLNYLGQAAFPDLPGWEPYTGTAMEDVIVSRRHGEIDRNPVLLNCTAIILDGQLVTRWEYSTSLHRPDTVERVAGAFVAALQALAHAEQQRRAQAGPAGAARAQEYVAPRTPLERQLALIWQEMLGVARVGIHDNFFALGGESMLSIRVVGRAKEVGLHLTPKQIFEHQTIAELAQAAHGGEGIAAEQEALAGPLPITPIQYLHLTGPQNNPHYNNIALLLETDQPPVVPLLTEALAHVASHHDALRLRFIQTDADWEALILPPDQQDIPVVTIDLADLPAEAQREAIQATVAEYQTSLNLTHGPIGRVAYLHLGDGRTGRLLLLFNHIVLDMVAMTVFLQDLMTAYQQLLQGQAVALPAKTTSVKYWAERQVRYAQSEQARREAAHWLALPWDRVSRLPLDYPDTYHLNTQGSLDGFTAGLGPAETKLLADRLPEAHGAQLFDAVLLALGRAFGPWLESGMLLVETLVHGRTTMFDDVDLSRTVSMLGEYVPIFVDESIRDDAALLEQVATYRRSMPSETSSFGALRWLSQDEQIRGPMRRLPRAEVMLNYMGQVTQHSDTSGLLRMAPEPLPPNMDPTIRRPDVFWCQGGIIDGCLSISILYSVNMYQRSTVEALVGRFQAALQSLALRCQEYAALQNA